MADKSKEITVYAILKFLEAEANSATNDDTKESIEVAKQCLESAYGIDIDARQDLELNIGLEQLIAASIIGQRPHKEATDEEKTQAEVFKNEGNELMKLEKYAEALDRYTKALEKDPNNAVYYSNRAAAYNKLEQWHKALDDCDIALAINPEYSKAYGRKGLALSGLNQHQEAIDNYNKGLYLDPTNENIRTNLQLAKEKLNSSGHISGAGMGGGLGSLFGGGMPDINALLSNPNTMNMVSQMMQNPAMMQMASSFMNNLQQSGAGNADSSSAPGGTGGPGGVDMNSFLRMGQQLAAQMQRNHPETVENLRNQLQGQGEDPTQRPPNNDGSSG